MARTGAPRLAHWAGYDVRGAVDAHRGAACSGPFIVLKRQTVKEPKHNPNMLLSLKRPRCAAAVAATAATATRPCAGAGKRLRRARAAVPEATRVILDGSKASTAMCCRRTGGSAPAAQPVQAVAMTSATRRSRRSGDGAHELFRPPNADGIVPHLILGIF